MNETTTAPLTGTEYTVRIADIALRDDWQIRVRMDSGTVRSYAAAMRAGASFPAVSVARVGGALYLLDGWHRLEAARLNGDADVRATVSDMSEEQAQWAAAGANLLHGLPLKSRELRGVFRAYVRSGQHRRGRRFRSYREIAADLAHRVSHSGVRNWMRQDFPAVYAQMGDNSPVLEGGPRDRPATTALSRAKDSLDQAVAEARGLPPEERQELLGHLREAGARISGDGAWEPGSWEADENQDF